MSSVETSAKVISDLATEMHAIRDQMKARGEVALTQALGSIFNEFPKLRAICWKQYTPYFMDGDPCTFSIGDVEYLTEDGIPDLLKYVGKEKYEDVEPSDYPCYGEDAGFEYAYRSAKDDPLAEAVGTLSGMVHDLDELMENIFGDHKFILALKGKVHVFDFDHD